MIITPEIWQLATISAPDDSRGLRGIYFDGEYAVVTDGNMLFAKKYAGPVLPLRWRVIPVWPKAIKSAVEIPETIGLHAAKTVGREGRAARGRVPGIRQILPQHAVVEIREVKDDYPPWRRLLEKDPPHGKGQRFGVALLRKMLDLAVFVGAPNIDLTINPGELCAAYLAESTKAPEPGHFTAGDIAMIMPCRTD